MSDKLEHARYSIEDLRKRLAYHEQQNEYHTDQIEKVSLAIEALTGLSGRAPAEKPTRQASAPKKRVPSAKDVPVAWRNTAKGTPRKMAFRPQIPRKKHGAKFFKATFAKMDAEQAIREYFQHVKVPVRAAQIAEELMEHGLKSKAKRPSAVIGLVLQRMEARGELAQIRKEWAPASWFTTGRAVRKNGVSAGRDGGSDRTKGRWGSPDAAELTLEPEG